MEKAGPSNNWHYNKELKDKAKALRKNMTKAEACLWKYVLKGNKMQGYGFRRQRPVLHYIADFMCKELMLIIEVDGFTHHFETTAQKDMEKEAKLQSSGFHILRFTDMEILTDIEYVRRTIHDYIDWYQKNDNK